jgi:hypothetical protein
MKHTESHQEKRGVEFLFFLARSDKEVHPPFFLAAAISPLS